MRNTIIFPLLAMIASLGGCATTEGEKKALTTTLPEQSPLTVVGLALYHPSSDVANLTESVRHVLNPADIYGPYAITVGTKYPIQEIQYDVHDHGKLKKVTSPLLVSGLDRKKDPVYEAWRKFCNDAEHMTKEEWALIKRTSMPLELEAIWSDECVPLK